jgi:hypothetical protein
MSNGASRPEIVGVQADQNSARTKPAKAAKRKRKRYWQAAAPEHQAAVGEAGEAACFAVAH